MSNLHPKIKLAVDLSGIIGQTFEAAKAQYASQGLNLTPENTIVSIRAARNEHGLVAEAAHYPALVPEDKKDQTVAAVLAGVNVKATEEVAEDTAESAEETPVAEVAETEDKDAAAEDMFG